MSSLVLPPDVATLAPKDIGRLVAEDLARLLPGASWKVTRDGVRSTDDQQVAEITLQRSSASTTGEGVWIHPSLVVHDRQLARWRKEERAVVGPHADVLFNNRLINISHVSTVEVLNAGHVVPPLADGRVDYDTFVAELLDDVMPNRERLRSPRTLSDLPDRWLWNVQPLVEWSVATGHGELAWPLVERSLRSETARRNLMRGLSDGREGQPVDTSNSLVVLGHTLACLGELVGPAPAWTEAD